MRHPVDGALVHGLVASLDGLWEHDSRRFDAVVARDWPATDGAGYVEAVAGDPDAVLLALRVGGAVHGHLVGRFAPADSFRRVPVAVLESMQVSTALRGAGSGSALLGAFVGWARGRGTQALSVTATAANDGARRFSASHGFTEQSVTYRRWLVPPPAGDDTVVPDAGLVARGSREDLDT
ncbi:GNAT family N-acetyltransferase [Cellulomonas sp. 179-A 4D5 NHS]|uniref:GNAT family N-acetyltransferase n=1 Tax=Cellulomonas sp. 179-A 4D5 NHS TaxID=3142378 RepID=UPI0039A0AFD5